MDQIPASGRAVLPARPGHREATAGCSFRCAGGAAQHLGDTEPTDLHVARGDELGAFANASDGVRLRVNRSASPGTGPGQSDQGFQEES